VQRFVSLSEVYGSPASELLPAPSDPGLVIDLEALAGEDGDLVDRYLAAIQMMRKNPGVEEVRDSDRALISSLLQSARTQGSE
jgi:hypothetical protein